MSTFMAKAQHVGTPQGVPQGWYVIEQDTAITGALPAEGEGPVTAVGESMRYLQDVVVPLLEQDA